MNESCHCIWMSHVTVYRWVMSLKWMSRDTRMNESCHSNAWVMSHVWMSHVTRMNESCHMFEWVMSHVWMSHVTRIIESCHHGTVQAASHVWMSHFTHVNQSLIRVTWLIHSYVCVSDSFIHICHCPSSVTRMNESFHTCEWVISHMWHDSLIHTCVWHDSFIHTCQSKQRWMSLCMNESRQCIWMSQVNQMNESCHTYEWVMSPCHCPSSATRMNESFHTCESVIDTCDMTHSFIRVCEWLIHSYVCVTWLIYSHMSLSKQYWICVTWRDSVRVQHGIH